MVQAAVSVNGSGVSRTVSYIELRAAAGFISNLILPDLPINVISKPATVKSNLWITRMKH